MKAKLLVSALLFAACGGSEEVALDARTAALAADTNFRRVGVELAQAAAFLADSRTFGAPFRCDEEPGVPDDLPGPCEPVDPAASAEAIADFLATRIFTETNLESEDGGAVTYRLRPEVVCEPYDQACATLLADTPIRLRVSSDEPGDVNVSVRVADARPFHIGLHADALEVQVGLAALRDALIQLGAQADTLPAVMEGRVALGIARHAHDDFTASLSILQEVRIHGADDGAPWMLEMARALPAVAARIDESKRELAVRLGLAALSMRGPVEAVFGAADAGHDAAESLAAVPEGTVGLRLAALTGETVLESLSAATDRIRIRNFSLGQETSVLDRDGAPLLTLDLNPLAGRAFDLVATLGEDSTELQFTPAFDLGLGIFFANAADLVEVPDWALEENLRIRLDGAAAPRLRLFDGVAEVLDGLLTLESDALAPVEVAAGMCLLPPQAEPAPEQPAAGGAEAPADHPFVGLAAGACEA